jgi:hypothetical protein
MENLDLGIGAGLAMVAFWGFIGCCVLAAAWDSIRKRDAQHETVRRLIESGQELDHELMDKLSLVSNDGDGRHDQALQITGYWILPVAAGMAVFGLIIGDEISELSSILLGVSGLLGVMGIGFLVAGKLVAQWYSNTDTTD